MATTIESPVFDEKTRFKGLKHIIGYQAHKRVCHTCCDLYECNQRITGSGLC